jgi:hypothetical protein
MSVRLKLPSQKQFNGDRAQDYSITPIYNENSQKAFRVINNGVGIVPHVSIPANPNQAYVKQFHDPAIASGIVVGKGRRKHKHKHKMGKGIINPAGSSTRGYGKKLHTKSHNPLGNTEHHFGQALPMVHGHHKQHGGRKMLAPHHIVHGDVPTMQSRYHLMPMPMTSVHHGGDFSGVNKYGAYKGGVPNIIPY